uniref:galanin-like peptide n=1 Tax=Myodes glareolus TaxID=447135 RepID=UPI00201FEA61|nr:galanin-like peptide [Myodes glareolus]
MACMHLALLVAILLSLAGTPETVPVHRGRGGWTLNSAGYLLGPGKCFCSILHGLPYSHSPRMTKRSLVETFIRPKNGDLQVLDRDIPSEAALKS